MGGDSKTCVSSPWYCLHSIQQTNSLRHNSATDTTLQQTHKHVRVRKTRCGEYEGLVRWRMNEMKNDRGDN